MSKIICLGMVLVFLLAGMGVSSEEQPTNTSPIEDVDYYAVIVGVETFEDLEYDEVVCIDEDAQSIYDKLVTCNWEEENIKILLNENATKENIHDAITGWLDDKENESDIVLFYYSGHGWKMPLGNLKNGHAYLFSYNNSDPRFDEGDISDVELDSYFDELESKNIVVVLDHCYAGRMRSLKQSGREILTAGGKYLFCPVDEDISIGHGIFTYYLLQGFDGVADLNDDGWITAREAFRYARFPTFYHSFWKQFPFITTGVGPQLPFIYDYHFGSIPLINYC